MTQSVAWALKPFHGQLLKQSCDKISSRQPAIPIYGRRTVSPVWYNKVRALHFSEHCHLVVQERRRKLRCIQAMEHYLITKATWRVWHCYIKHRRSIKRQLNRIILRWHLKTWKSKDKWVRNVQRKLGMAVMRLFAVSVKLEAFQNIKMACIASPKLSKNNLMARSFLNSKRQQTAWKHWKHVVESQKRQLEYSKLGSALLHYKKYRFIRWKQLVFGNLGDVEVVQKKRCDTLNRIIGIWMCNKYKAVFNTWKLHCTLGRFGSVLVRSFDKSRVNVCFQVWKTETHAMIDLENAVSAEHEYAATPSHVPQLSSPVNRLSTVSTSPLGQDSPLSTNKQLSSPSPMSQPLTPTEARHHRLMQLLDNILAVDNSEISEQLKRDDIQVDIDDVETEGYAKHRALLSRLDDYILPTFSCDEARHNTSHIDHEYAAAAQIESKFQQQHVLKISPSSDETSQQLSDTQVSQSTVSTTNGSVSELASSSSGSMSGMDSSSSGSVSELASSSSGSVSDMLGQSVSQDSWQSTSNSSYSDSSSTWSSRSSTSSS